MPQMAPILWLPIMFSITTLLLLCKTSVYFSPKFSSSSSSSLPYPNPLNWMW